MDEFIYGILGLSVGIALSLLALFIWNNIKEKKAEDKASKILKEAEKKSEELLEKSKKESLEIIKKAEKTESRILEKEEKIDKKLENLEHKQENISKKEEDLVRQKEELEKTQLELDGKIQELSKLSEQEAREIFLKEISEKFEQDGKDLIVKHKKKIEDNKKEEAREIILKAIQQYAGDVTSEVTMTLIQIPSDDIKGKLIGKEGRNITTFERCCGVSLIIDDTPDTVFISAFDLYRRYIAKKSLEKLIEDGRIQPARIEEIVAKTEQEAEILLRDLGNKILDELSITTVPDEIIPVIGKLRFRTSYGQNILKHSKEVALIAESLAKDLGADPYLCKVGGLLHDIGKALDQEYEGTHPEIGGILARKYKMDEKIIDVIENHHQDPFTISLNTAIVQVADAISSVRPGARREVIEDYLKRVQEMEALVSSFHGVNKAYALSAGREIRVFVDAKTISDMEALNMAREIADNIQEKLSYPGEVKVNLIREMRVIEIAK
ncbi:ribonuclease Y [Candidatus Gracilibacteria bacterium]|nr:MAG: ribonuclease Y [Candidatus Gracilibacteria bacterium]